GGGSRGIARPRPESPPGGPPVRRSVWFGVGRVLALALPAPSPGSGRQGGSKKGKSRNFEVRMVNGNMFDAKDIEIQVGDTVTWINASGAKHSATADGDSEITFPEVVLESGEFSKKRQTFDKAGTVKYHCKFHAATM